MKLSNWVATNKPSCMREPAANPPLTVTHTANYL